VSDTYVAKFSSAAGVPQHAMSILDNFMLIFLFPFNHPFFFLSVKIEFELLFEFELLS